MKKGSIKARKLITQSLAPINFTYELSKNGTVIVKRIPEPYQPATTSSAKKEQSQISGTVNDIDGSPLPGASVLEKGTSNGTTTDF